MNTPKLLLAAAAVAALAANAGAIERGIVPGGMPAAATGPAAKAPGSIQTPHSTIPGAPSVHGVPNAIPAAAPSLSVQARPGGPSAVLPGAPEAQQPGGFRDLSQVSAAFGDQGRSADFNGAAVGQEQFDGAFAGASSFRFPTYTEQRKIDESLARASDRRNDGRLVSPIASDLIQEFRNLGGQFAIDDDASAAYHGTAFRDRFNKPTVVLTADTINNGSWAFILSVAAREMMNFNDWYKIVPPSAERLAIQYAHMAMVFAEATNGSLNAWSTNLDHNHQNQGTYMEWSWYQKLQKAIVSTTGFADSQFFTWLRDVTSKQVASNVAYQYSLWERFSGTHDRPGTALDKTPIPSSVPRLTQAQHDPASERIYGTEAKPNNDESLIGQLIGWFRAKGNI